MTPAEIEALVGAVILLIQIIQTQMDASTLTDDEKKAFIDRISAAQAAIPDWK